MNEWTLDLKKELLAFCRQEVEGRIGEHEAQIEAIQEAANQETKSSAGDKYETGRAMMQRERAQATARLAESVRLKAILDKVAIREMDQVQLGAIVRTSKGRFLFAAPLGKLQFQGEEWYALSLASPLGKLMAGKSQGDIVSINGRQFELLQVL